MYLGSGILLGCAVILLYLLTICISQIRPDSSKLKIGPDSVGLELIALD